ncbi:SHOCT domain-containing protein [Sphingomonas crocodyli]|uniref:SHOCT domain-containing protein n=1 Tax=Sphingomonas crocodyli TaxID=1979270 RepID=A0A437M6E0_9SPHN|nr:SHOCT domain-containing protein [Sphingomonas crocodyli]RVT93125.1 SHOCT domain-containing protein [Sphingomonas crocodyli]
MTDRIEALERLARLKTEGVLTDAEFEQQKQFLLGQGTSSAPSAEPAVGTFAYGWQKSRGIRRVFYWFFGLQALAIALMVVYFLLRVFVFPEPRPTTDATGANAIAPAEDNATAPEGETKAIETAPVVGEAQPYFQVEATITDASLQNPWNLDGDFPEDAPNRQDACPLGQVSIVNRSSQALSLDIMEIYGDSPNVTLPKLEQGMMATYQPPHVGQFLIRHLQPDGFSGFYLLNVVNCPPND